MIQKTKFKETEVGLIPEDWRIISLNETGKLVTGKTPPSKNPEFMGSSVMFVTPTDFKNYNKDIFHSERYISDEGKNKFSKQLLSENSVLVTCIGSDMGKVAIVKNICLTNQQINSIIPYDNYSPDFLYYKLKSIYSKLKMLATSGSTMPIVNKTDFGNIKISIPNSKHIQERQVELLSKMDLKIDLLNQQNKTLEKIGQVLFKQWFVDFEFPNEEGKPYKSSGGKMIDSELGEIPEGWEVKELQDFIELQKGLSYKGKSLVQEGGLPMANLGTFLPIKGFKSDGLKHYDGEHKERHLVSPGDMLIANTDITQKRDILGSPAIIPKEIGSNQVLFTHHTFAVRFKNNTLPKPYLYYLLQTPEYRQRAIGFATGTTVLALPKDAILELSFVLPKDELLNTFKEITRSIFEKRGVNEQSILFLSKTRDLLLPKLMTGKIRVPLEGKE